MKGTQRSLALTLLYVLLAGIWIIFSDQLLTLPVRYSSQMATFQTVKGWIFVAISATLLYSLLRYEMRKRQDVTAELYRLNRALRTLSACTQTRIHTTEEPDLLQRICQSIVVVGGYPMAWVGYPDQDSAPYIRPMDRARIVAGYFEPAQISWEATEYGQGPASQALRTGQPCVIRDILTDPAFEPWRVETEQHGYAAVIALPLISIGQTLGVLTIYTGTPEAFDAEEVRLLTELSSDLAVAIDNLRLRSAHQPAEVAQQHSHERLSNILERITDAFFALDHTWHFIYVNCKAEQFLRCPRATLLGQNIWEVVPDTVRSIFYTVYDQVREQQGPVIFAQFYPPLETWLKVHAYPSLEGITVYVRDTTVQKHAADHQATRLAVTRILAESETPTAAIPQLLQAMCEGMDWELGQMWQVDTSTDCLAWEEVWYQPTRDAQEFSQASHAVNFARGQEMVGRVWASGEPTWITDLTSDSSLQHAALAVAHGFHTTLAFPIRNGREVTGVLVFFSRKIRQPDDNIFTLTTDIGRQIGQFIARKLAEESLAWEAEVNAAMATMSHQLIALVAPETIAMLVLEQAKQLTGSAFGYVGYIDTQTGFLVCPTMTRDIWDACQVTKKSIVFKQFCGLWGWVLDHQQPLLTNDPTNDSRSTGTPVGHVSIERFLSVPAMMGPTLLGQISLANAPRAYTEKDLTVIQRMASLYALAIQRKRDENAIQQYAGRLQHIHEIDRAILSAHSPADIAQATLSHLYKLVPYQHACVALFESETDTARILAKYAYDTFHPLIQERIPLATFRSMVALWEGQTYVKTTVERDGWQLPCCEGALSIHLRSFVTVPLLVQQNIIGALTLGATTPDAFHAESLELVHEVVNQLAIAIQQARLFEQIHDGHERLQTLSRRLVEIQEVERRHIARELHDEIGQTLTGLHLLLEMQTRTVSTRSQNLQNAQMLVNELMQRVREISLDLRPAMLDDLGLLPTLRWHFSRYTTQTGIEVRFKHNGIERRFAPDIETAIYRLVQEALTNVARHAQVDILTVRLWADEELLEVQIEDTGVGFDQDSVLASKMSSGLTGMRERMELIGGTFTLRSQPEQGTCLAVTVPLKRVVVAMENHTVM